MPEDLLLPQAERVDRELLAVHAPHIRPLAVAVAGEVERHHPLAEVHHWPSAKSPSSSVFSAVTASSYHGSPERSWIAACIVASCSGPWRGRVLARIRRSTRSACEAAYAAAATPPCE